MKVTQEALVFDCENERLIGILSRPDHASARGVLVVVGGPQYRVGSHRQFLLLANSLAAEGTPVLRFDYRGMGDSTGEARNFEQVSLDIGAACGAFFSSLRGLREIVIWGLCDAASAALFYAHNDPRIGGLVLLNPWVHTVQGEAQAYLRHYYLQRLLSPAPWRKLLRGEFRVRDSWTSLISNFRKARGATDPTQPADVYETESAVVSGAESLSPRMADGLARFSGHVLLILSGNDLTASEFVDVTNASKRWRQLLREPRVTQRSLPAATHTFSSSVWRDQVAAWTAGWIKSW